MIPILRNQMYYALIRRLSVKDFLKMLANINGQQLIIEVEQLVEVVEHLDVEQVLVVVEQVLVAVVKVPVSAGNQLNFAH